MRKTFCLGVLLLSGAMFVVAIISKGLLDDLVLLLFGTAILYGLMRFVRWLLRRVAPILRWLAVLAFFAAMLYLAARELAVLGAEGLFVMSILLIFVWAVVCPTNPKRARA